ncbi:hypothetical protein BHM03_00017970, partial [Ensete ventricosum]
SDRKPRSWVLLPPFRPRIGREVCGGGGLRLCLGMAGGGGGGDSRELDQTPTWAVAAVCAVIVVISILLEKGLHHFGEWLNEKHKKALYEALEKVKAGKTKMFISLFEWSLNLVTFNFVHCCNLCCPVAHAWLGWH